MFVIIGIYIICKGVIFMKKRIAGLVAGLLLLSLLPTAVSAHNCVDRDRDYWCDDCGMLIYHTCVDANKDTFCDKCSCWIPHDCADRDSDHKCDQCGRVMDVNINITVDSYLSASEAVTLYFYEGTYPSVFATVNGSPAKHTFRCAANSHFQLMVMKTGHPTRSYSYSTYNSDIGIYAELYPYGDASQDGRVNVGDVAKIYAHVRGTDEIYDDYAFECADVSGDGDLTVGDTAKVYAHVKQTKPLW